MYVPGAAKDALQSRDDDDPNPGLDENALAYQVRGPSEAEIHGG